MLILHIIFWVLFVVLASITVYFFIVSIAGKIYSSPKYQVHPDKKRIAVLIPTYKEDQIILSTAKKASEHQYSGIFKVFVAADQLQASTIEQLRTLPIEVLPVKFEISSKARSLNQLLNHIDENAWDIALILDADNVMEAGVLEKINHSFQNGFKAAQSNRTAKNQNTTVAILDGLSEGINNHLFRKGQRALGFASNTIGSGMAFEFKTLKAIYNKPGILGNPACDREVDFEIMKRDVCIEFIDNANVYDEKVAQKAVYEKQRTRWFESQIIHLKLFFDPKEQPIPHTKDYYNKLWVNLIPPRLLIILGLMIGGGFAIINDLFKIHWIAPAPVYWYGLILLFAVTFAIAIPNKFYRWSTVKALFYVPVLVWSAVKAVINMKVSRKEFVHTPKTFTEDPHNK
jgi:cellulose synthase/poly-beta-1,6-N-acetylglucosamine synthase-like glycosyltransferase